MVQREKRVIPGPAGNYNSSPSATQSQIMIPQTLEASQNSLKRKAYPALDSKMTLVDRKQNILQAGIRKYGRILKKSNAWKIARESMGDRFQGITTIDTILTEIDRYQVKKILLFIKDIILKPSHSLEASSCLFTDSTGEIKATLDESFINLIGAEELSIGSVVELENVSILRLDHRSHLVLCDYHVKAFFTPEGKMIAFNRVHNDGKLHNEDQVQNDDKLHNEDQVQNDDKLKVDERIFMVETLTSLHSAEQEIYEAKDTEEYHVDENDYTELLKAIKDWDENDLF